MLRLFIHSSEFLTSLTVGLGAQICDPDLAAVSKWCPHLQQLELRFAMVSEMGAHRSPWDVAQRGHLTHSSCCSKCLDFFRQSSFLRQTSTGVSARGHVHRHPPWLFTCIDMLGTSRATRRLRRAHSSLPATHGYYHAKRKMILLALQTGRQAVACPFRANCQIFLQVQQLESNAYLLRTTRTCSERNIVVVVIIIVQTNEDGTACRRVRGSAELPEPHGTAAAALQRALWGRPGRGLPQPPAAATAARTPYCGRCTRSHQPRPGRLSFQVTRSLHAGVGSAV